MTLYLEASPKAISERTSYLKFVGISPLPHLIPALFNVRGFRPPVSITLPSILDMGRSPGFRVYDLLLMRPYSDSLSLTAPLFPLNLATNRNSPVHSTKGTLSPINGL